MQLSLTINSVSPRIVGFDEHFAPTCVRKHSYRYDSYDSRYQIQYDSLYQKVFKMKITNDLRKYSSPVRIQKLGRKFIRNALLERVIAYLKEYFQLNNIRFRTGEKYKVHFDLVTLAYNSAKLVADKMNRQIQLIVA